MARRYFTWTSLVRADDRLLTLLGTTAPLIAIYTSSRGPEITAGSWRKPSQAVLTEAYQENNLNLKKSLLGGNRQS